MKLRDKPRGELTRLPGSQKTRDSGAPPASLEKLPLIKPQPQALRDLYNGEQAKAPDGQTPPDQHLELAAVQKLEAWELGPAGAVDVAAVFGGELPQTHEEVSTRLSDAVAQRYGLLAGREPLLEKRRGSGLTEAERATLAQLDTQLSVLDARIDALRGFELPEGGKPGFEAKKTSFIFALRVSAGVTGIGAANFDVGAAVTAKKEETGKRSIEPFVGLGGGTPIVGGGYNKSSNPASTGASLGVSGPFAGVGGDNLYGRYFFAFVPGLASLTLTERGGIGVSFSPPVLPFVGVGFIAFVENPVIARLTGPVVKGIDKLVAPAVQGMKNAVGWVKEHVLHRPTAAPGSAQPA